MRIPFFILIASMLLPLHVEAQEAPAQIVVTGVGRASAPPDKAVLRIEVSRKGRQTDVLMDEIADAMGKVLAVVRVYGVSDVDIETTQLSLRERWEYDGDTRVFSGYEASTTITVQVRDLSGIGNLVTTISKDGASEIRGPNFAIEDSLALRDEARRNAVLDGMATARLLAEAAGVTLGPPLLITDGTEGSEDLIDGTIQMEEPVEEPMVMEDVAVEIAENGVAVLPADIETFQTVKLIFRIDP